MTQFTRNRFVEQELPITLASASGTPPQPPAAPLDCAQAWDEVDKEADKIINSTNDPIERNKRFNAAYAKLYLEDPSLHWAGVAAFASKQVGCGLQSAKNVLDLGDVEMEGMKYGGDGIDPITAYKYDKAKTVYDALTVGNRAVFKDIYPVHRFYQKHGIEGLRKCGNARTPRVDPRVMQGFEDIAAGHSDSGATNILYHEQHDILEAPNIFGNKKIEGIMQQNQSASNWAVGRFFGAERTTTAFSPECAGGPTVTFDKANPALFDERWPFAQQVAGKFENLISNPQTQPQILRDLQVLAQRGH